VVRKNITLTVVGAATAKELVAVAESLQRSRCSRCRVEGPPREEAQ
jgi:hypothetical protein